MVRAHETHKPKPAPRGRRQANMPNGRQALLEAALSAFATNGFDSADLRTIAAAAGVSPNLVRVHFGSKGELWEACLQALVVAAKPVIAKIGVVAGDTERPLAQKLREVILFLADFYAAQPEARDFVARHLSEPPERSARITEHLLLPAYESLRELVADGIAAGHIRAAHPVLFFALLNSALSQPASFPLLIEQLAPELDPIAARKGLTVAIIASLVQEAAPA